MKTTSKITLFLSLGLFATACSTNETTDLNEDLNTQVTTASDTDTVWMNDAQLAVNHYQNFQSLIPVTCKWDAAKNELSFEPIRISDTKLADSLTKWSENATDGKFEFPYQNAIATSYFVPKQDLEEALKKSTEADGGLRLYMAMHKNNMESDGSHLFITPAYRTITARDTTYTDVKLSKGSKHYVLDLTTPCPKACPSNPIF